MLSPADLGQLVVMAQVLPQILSTLQVLLPKIEKLEQQHEIFKMGRERSHSESSIYSTHTLASAATGTTMPYDAFCAALLQNGRSAMSSRSVSIIPGTVPAVNHVNGIPVNGTGLTGSRREKEEGRDIMVKRMVSAKSPSHKKFLDAAHARRQSKSDAHFRRKSNPGDKDSLELIRAAQREAAAREREKAEQSQQSQQSQKVKDIKDIKDRPRGPPSGKIRKRSKSQDNDDRGKVGKLKRRSTMSSTMAVMPRTGRARAASILTTSQSLKKKDVYREEKEEETDDEEYNDHDQQMDQQIDQQMDHHDASSDGTESEFSEPVAFGMMARNRTSVESQEDLAYDTVVQQFADMPHGRTRLDTIHSMTETTPHPVRGYNVNHNDNIDDSATLYIVRAWYGHSKPALRYECDDGMGKDVTDIVQSHVVDNELNLNPSKQAQYFNELFQFGKSWRHKKVVAIRYRFGNGPVREYVTNPTNNEKVSIHILNPDAIDTIVEEPGFFKRHSTDLPNIMLEDVMDGVSAVNGDEFIADAVHPNHSNHSQKHQLHQRKKPLSHISTTLHEHKVSSSQSSQVSQSSGISSQSSAASNVLKFQSSPHSPNTTSSNPSFFIDKQMTGNATQRSRSNSARSKSTNKRNKRRKSLAKSKPATPSKSAAITADTLHPIPVPKSPSMSTHHLSGHSGASPSITHTPMASSSVNPFVSPQRPNTPTHSGLAVLPQSPTPTPTNSPNATESSKTQLKPPREDDENESERSQSPWSQPNHRNPMGLSLDPAAYSSDIEYDKVELVEEEDMINNVKELRLSSYSSSTNAVHSQSDSTVHREQSLVEEAMPKINELSNANTSSNVKEQQDTGNSGNTGKTGEDSVSMASGANSSRPTSTRMNKAVHFGIIEEEENQIEVDRNLLPSNVRRQKSGGKSKGGRRRKSEKGHARKLSLSQRNLSDHNGWTNLKSKLGNMRKKDVEKMTDSQLEV